jgi:peptide-methionine (S)-S-oxide reductase
MTVRPALPLRHLLALLLLALASGCSPGSNAGGARERASPAARPGPAPPPGTAVATFAGGCFWCMEPPFDALEGVFSTTSGYMGGEEEQPTYEQVSAGRTGHAEVVQVTYDPQRISYPRLLEVFWRNIDPTARDRQFCDRGRQYRSAIFAHDAEQRRLAEETRSRLEAERRFAAPIVTEVVDAGAFWPAEEYHQDYYLKNPLRYQTYRRGCGRDARLRELWGDQAGG